MTGRRTFKLSSGEEVIVRQPRASVDLARLVGFLAGLSPKERSCFRYDVAQKEPCRVRLRQVDGRHHFRLIAEMGGAIVGDVTLDRFSLGFAGHVGDLRGVISGEADRKLELGTVLLRELLRVAEKAGFERLMSAVLPGHESFIEILTECGFVHEATLEGFARDIHGSQHDLWLFTKDLAGAWERLAELVEDMDIRIPQ